MKKRLRAIVKQLSCVTVVFLPRLSFDEGLFWNKYSFTNTPLFVDGVLGEPGEETLIMTWVTNADLIFSFHQFKTWGLLAMLCMWTALIFLEMFMEIYVEIPWANRRVKRTEEKACVVNTASPWRPPCLPSSCSRSGTRLHWVASVTVGPLARWMGCPTKVSCKSTSALGAISLGRAVWLLFPVDGCVWIILAGRMAGWIYGWT